MLSSTRIWELHDPLCNSVPANQCFRLEEAFTGSLLCNAGVGD